MHVSSVHYWHRDTNFIDVERMKGIKQMSGLRRLCIKQISSRHLDQQYKEPHNEVKFNFHLTRLQEFYLHMS